MSQAERDDNAETSAFVVATNRAMKIMDGKEALYLLAKSDRIKEDLNKIFPYGKDHFSLSLILREWVEEVIERPQVRLAFLPNQGMYEVLTRRLCSTSLGPLFTRTS